MTPLLLYTIYYIRHNRKIPPYSYPLLTFPIAGVVRPEVISRTPFARVINIRILVMAPLSPPTNLRFQPLNRPVIILSFQV
jgi:hypothetical protein